MPTKEEITAAGSNKIWWEWKKVNSNKGVETYRLSPVTTSYVRLSNAN